MVIVESLKISAATRASTATVGIFRGRETDVLRQAVGVLHTESDDKPLPIARDRMNRELRDQPIFVFQLHVEVIALEKRSSPVDDICQFARWEAVVDVISNPCLKAEKRGFAEGGSTIKEGLVHTPDFSDVGVRRDKSSIRKHESEVESGILFEGRN
jgi:hypothetical protein